MENVLVTGSSGFTGNYVVTELKRRGYNVTEVSKTKKAHDKVNCDLTNKASVKQCLSRHKPDYIIHLAAISFVGSSDQKSYYDVNVFSTLNILESCYELGINPKKIILSSSANVYGNPLVDKVNESSTPAPINHYAMSKMAMECMSKLWFEKLSILITRPFNYIGVGQDEKFLVPKIVNHFKSNKKVIELGNLDVSRDFSDVLDISCYYVDLMESSIKSEIVNLCSGKAQTLMGIIREMEYISGHSIEVKVNDKFVRNNEIKTLVGDNSKLISITGRSPVHRISETLRRMYHG